MQADNLFTEGKADTGTVILSGEERHEDTLRHFRQHTFSVVADFENEFLGMSFYLDADVRMGAMGTCFTGILQQVNKYLLHLCAVGISGELGRRAFILHFQFRVKSLQVGKKLFQWDFRLHRGRDAGQFPVILYELQQAFPPAVDDL